MSPSSSSDQNIHVDATLALSEEQGDDDQQAKAEQEQDESNDQTWLTSIRRRCELCKQRKVRCSLSFPILT